MQEHIDRVESWANTLKAGQAPHQQPLADSALVLVAYAKAPVDAALADINKSEQSAADRDELVENLRAHLRRALDDLTRQEDSVASLEEKLQAAIGRINEFENHDNEV